MAGRRSLGERVQNNGFTPLTPPFSNPYLGSIEQMTIKHGVKRMSKILQTESPAESTLICLNFSEIEDKFNFNFYFF